MAAKKKIILVQKWRRKTTKNTSLGLATVVSSGSDVDRSYQSCSYENKAKIKKAEQKPKQSRNQTEISEKGREAHTQRYT